MAKESWYINESELDDFQVKIVRRNLNSSFIVKGCAGSGKTVLALPAKNDYMIKLSLSMDIMLMLSE